jgi:hypothetical protein
LVLIAKVTEEVVEEAREKVLVRSGRIGRHAVVKQFILESLSVRRGARDFAAVGVCGFEKMLVFVMRMRTLSAHRGSHGLGTRTNGGLSKWRPL